MIIIPSSNPSILNGGYFDTDPDFEAIINTRAQYISINDFFAQGEDAMKIIEEIHDIWASEGDMNALDAIKAWSNIYL